MATGCCHRRPQLDHGTRLCTREYRRGRADQPTSVTSRIQGLCQISTPATTLRRTQQLGGAALCPQSSYGILVMAPLSAHSQVGGSASLRSCLPPCASSSAILNSSVPRRILKYPQSVPVALFDTIFPNSAPPDPPADGQGSSTSAPHRFDCSHEGVNKSCVKPIQTAIYRYSPTACAVHSGGHVEALSPATIRPS